MKQIMSFLLLFFLCIQIQAQERTVTGVVTDASTKEPLPGVSVLIEGTTLGTASDLDGKFSITVPGEKSVLIFSYVGYVKQNVVVGTTSTINVALEPSLKELEEVVVVGYGVQKKSLVTGAIAKVDAEEIAKGGNLRASQALQGKTAGVVVMNNSGQPGSGVQVTIRGIGTNGDSNPLYIVDGLPLDGNGIDFLSPSDIESIEVLKDAASAAIYGTRGANGVVLITTKQGRKGDKFQVSYEGYYGVQNPSRKLDVLNSKEYLMLINEAAANANQPAKFSPALVDSFTRNYNTDWQDKMFNYNAPKQSHTVNFTGGSDKATYSSSFSYLGQEGIVAKGKSNYDRYTYRLNTTREFGIINLGSNINYANIQTKGISENDQYNGTALIQALNCPPIVPVYMADGSYGTPEKMGVGMQEITNPIAMLNYTNSTTVTNKVVGTMFADLDFGKLFKGLSGLKFRSSYGMEYTNVHNRNYTPKYSLDATHLTTINSAGASFDIYKKWIVENYLSYDKTIGENHFSLMAGQSAYKDSHESLGGSKNDLIFNDLEHAYLNNAKDPLSAQIYGDLGEHTVASLFGRINYDLKDKYMLTAIVRRDGSSRFGSENKYGTFPSVSLGWVISKENFMSSFQNFLDFMKLRASWGQNGNENIGDFRYTSVISTGATYYFGADKTQYQGAQPSYYSNPFVRWEASEQTDLGLDLAFFSNRITLTVDAYNKATKDWLLTVPIMMLAGNSAPVVNGGKVVNQGIEAELGFKNQFGKFHMDLTLTGNVNRNEVKEINNLEQRLTGGTGAHGQADIIQARVGAPMSQFYGYKTAGIFQNQAEVDAYVNSNGGKIQPNAQPGDVRFVDANGDGTLSDLDRVKLGSPFPKFTGGLNFNASYGPIDFTMFWYTSLGAKIWEATRRFDINYANFRGEALERWTGEGTSNKYPRVTLDDKNNNWKTPSDLFVKDADYLRLRNLTIGFTLPKTVSQKLKLEKLRLFVSGENLVTITNYDGFEPEIGGGLFSRGVDHGNYPQARTILGGVQVNF